MACGAGGNLAVYFAYPYSNTVDFVYKKGGKTAMNERCVVSKDGKIATVTFEGKDTKGVGFTVVTVWEKQ